MFWSVLFWVALSFGECVFLENVNTRLQHGVETPKGGHQDNRCGSLKTYPRISVSPLAPNDIRMSRTAQLTSRRCILNIYSTNILTEYFKHASNSPFFYLQDAVYFIMLSFLVPVIFTF